MSEFRKLKDEEKAVAYLEIKQKLNEEKKNKEREKIRWRNFYRQKVYNKKGNSLINKNAKN